LVCPRLRLLMRLGHLDATRLARLLSAKVS
jgi:hypothetical protein